MLGGSAPPAARRAAQIADGFLPADPSLWEIYRDELRVLGKPDPGPYFPGDARVVVLTTDPDAAWDEWAPYFLHDINQYGAWGADADGTPSFRPLSNVDEVKASAQYRVLTPSEYVAELRASPVAYTLLHPMVGGAPPELAWNSLKLFEHDVLPKL
jgi:alkanesulfonate monooxygenase SsuD/methylene tetrahydromethanopterin reductase-like flavin-dependent oxidoreductase (luciferase family)